MPSQHPQFPLDHAEQAAWAAARVSVKATAIALCQRWLDSIIGHMVDHAMGCWHMPGFTGDARAQWLETFFSEASGLRKILTHVILTGDKTSQEPLEIALAVLQSRLGWFPDTQPTVEAVAS